MRRWRTSSILVLLLTGCVTDNNTAQLHVPFVLGSLRYILQDITLETGHSLPGVHQLKFTLWVNNPASRAQTFEPSALSIIVLCDYNRQVFQLAAPQEAAAAIDPGQTIETVRYYDVPNGACDQGLNVEFMAAGQRVLMPIFKPTLFD